MEALMENKILVHKHLIIRAEAKNPPMEESLLRQWFEQFILDIGMKVMMGPYVKYSNMVGNRGITGAAIIETSHIVMHVWDEVSPALMQFDVYSCGELDPEKICKKLTKDFIIEKLEYKFLDRKNDLKDINIFGSTTLSLFNNKSINFIIQNTYNYISTDKIKTIQSTSIGIKIKTKYER